MQDASDTDNSRAKHRRWVFLTLPAVAFVLGSIATILTAQSRSEPYQGVYRQEAVPVFVERSGRLVEAALPSGSAVEPGDPLCTIEDAERSQLIASLKAEQERISRQLARASASAEMELTLRRDEINKQRLETQLRLADLLRSRFDVDLRRKAAENLAKQSREQVEQGLSVVPTSAESITVQFRLDLADAENEIEVLNTQIVLCEDRLKALDRLESALSQRIEQTHDVARIQSELADVTERLVEAEQQTASVQIASPAYGHVGVYRRRAGEFVAVGDTLVEIFDAQRPYILLSVPVAELAELTQGRHVRVEFEGVPTRKPLEGVVASVMSDAERNADIAQRPGSTLAEVRICPVGRLWPAPRAGTTANVYLLGGKPTSQEH